MKALSVAIDEGVCAEFTVVDVVRLVEDHNALVLKLRGYHLADLRIEHALVIADEHLRVVDDVPRQKVRAPAVLNSYYNLKRFCFCFELML